MNDTAIVMLACACLVFHSPNLLLAVFGAHGNMALSKKRNRGRYDFVKVNAFSPHSAVRNIHCCNINQQFLC